MINRREQPQPAAAVGAGEHINRARRPEHLDNGRRNHDGHETQGTKRCKPSLSSGTLKLISRPMMGTLASFMYVNSSTFPEGGSDSRYAKPPRCQGLQWSDTQRVNQGGNRSGRQVSVATMDQRLDVPV